MTESPLAVLSVLAVSLFTLIGCFPVPVNTTDEQPAVSTSIETANQQSPADIAAPILSAVSVTVTDNNTIMVKWKTNEEATSEIKLYDVTNSVEIPGGSDNKYMTAHEIAVAGSILKPATTYSLSVVSRDRAGNMASHDNVRMLSLNTLAAQNASYRIFTLPSLNGNQVRLADFKDKMVFLHFWLYGCPACEEGMPLISSIYDSTPQDELPMLTISIQADSKLVADYVKSHGYKFPVMLDNDGVVATAYKVGPIPSTFIVDSQGTIIKKKEGKFDSLYDIRIFMGQKSFPGGF
jgi:peroxiredoxin